MTRLLLRDSLFPRLLLGYLQRNFGNSNFVTDVMYLFAAFVAMIRLSLERKWIGEESAG
jgi:hypothetical protein